MTTRSDRSTLGAYPRHLVAALLLCLAAGSALLCTAQENGADGAPTLATTTVLPGLTDLAKVPAPAVLPAALPEPATWPALRHERQLRMLHIGNQGTAVNALQRVARRLQARLDLVFTAERGGDGTPHHINTLIHTHDQWIEARANPSAVEVADEADRHRDAVLATAAGTYDVIFSSQLLPELLAYVEQGGIWVICSNVTPAEDSPLAAIWPVTPQLQNGRVINRWHHGGAVRGEGFELAGLPLDRLSSHQWHAIYHAVPGAEALAEGQSGAAFLRRVGDGVLLFVPTGPISRTVETIAKLHPLYDHDEIWLRYWDQLLHGLVGGATALPVMVDLQAGEEPARAGASHSLAGTLRNRSAGQQQVTTSLHVLSPAGDVVYIGDPLAVSLAPGASHEWEIELPVAEAWPAGHYAVFLTVGDPAASKQLHQAQAFMPVEGVLSLALSADQPGYRIGETATFSLEATAAVAWDGEVRWAVHDYLGRVLGGGTSTVALGADATVIPFAWEFVDHGVRVDTVWATAAAVRHGREWGRVETKVYKHEPWDMRNEYQWSTWPRIAGGPPSLLPRAMRLMAHAGFNALGYPAGGRELYYPAERWSWRMYNEGVGTNTFSPVIESVTDEEIEAAQRQTLRLSPDHRSGAYVLASIGEEAGFKSGWGRTYYWDGPVAPERASQAFQRFLRERYPSLGVLNAAWGTHFQAWEEIHLTREFSGKAPTLAADGWAHPREETLLDAGTDRVTLAPFSDTQSFYHWYYDKVIEVALRIFREEVNTVPLTMASAPSSWIFVSPRCEARVAHNTSWVESQQWSLAATAEEPGFAMAWGHFDWPVATENVLWSFIISRSGHNNYWVDVPMHFNPDMTPTRSAWAIRRWREQTRHAERLLLDARPVHAEAGVLGPAGSFAGRVPRNAADSVKVALNQGGFGFADADFADLQRYRILFAMFQNTLSPAEAEALHAYVEGGGTLVIGPRLAGQDAHGVAQEVVPAHGLAARWGLQVTDNDPVPAGGRRSHVAASLASLGEPFAELHLRSDLHYLESVDQEGWTTLVAYDDERPALMTRTLGQGRLVYLNATYESNWYIQWSTPTDRARQGFYRLIEKLCLDAGVRRSFRIDGDLAQSLHMAALTWQDASGEIGYAVTRTHGQTIWTGGTLNWLGPQTTAYDVFGGNPRDPAPVYGREVALQLRPGAGRLLAFTQAPIETIRLGLPPASIAAGDGLPITVDILDAAGQPVPGSFPLQIQVFGPDGELAGLRRDLSMASGETTTIPTALSEPAGSWRVQVRDGISRLTATAEVTVRPSAEAAALPDRRPWGWPSELWEPATMPDDQFTERLQRLATLYRTDHSGGQWLAKQWLGAHYCFLPGTRHDLTRDLMELDWTRHVEALRQAVTTGSHLILVGEDLGLDPATGLAISPHVEARQLEAVADAMREATWEAISSDGETIRARLGSGSLVLSRTTPDGASSSWGWAAAWQQQFLASLAAAPTASFAPPDAAGLAAWLAGRASLVTTPRQVIWEGGWEAINGRRPVWHDDLWTTKLAPTSEGPGPVFLLRLPPTGAIRQASLAITVTGDGPVAIDIGARGGDKLTAEPGETTVTVAPELLNSYFGWREDACGGIERDLNGWRLVPIRFNADNGAEITLRRMEALLD